jgi:hypothetical protein
MISSTKVVIPGLHEGVSMVARRADNFIQLLAE